MAPRSQKEDTTVPSAPSGIGGVPASSWCFTRPRWEPGSTWQLTVGRYKSCSYSDQMHPRLNTRQPHRARLDTASWNTISTDRFGKALLVGCRHASRARLSHVKWVRIPVHSMSGLSVAAGTYQQFPPSDDPRLFHRRVAVIPWRVGGDRQNHD